MTSSVEHIRYSEELFLSVGFKSTLDPTDFYCMDTVYFTISFEMLSVLEQPRVSKLWNFHFW